MEARTTRQRSGQAIASHRTIYIPTGRYIVTDTITLRPDTVLIGLNPSTTQFDIPDSTPAFQGPGSPKALLEAPKGGTNIVTGIGLYTNGINSRAVGAKWMAGKDSLMDDVRFLGGHGTTLPGVSFNTIYNNTHTADTDINRRWDSQYPSLWVTDGGGGTFANIWTPSTFAQAGMMISNTTTEGRVYELSSEHHVRNEIKIDHASNWKIYALQTEEERGEGPFALPLSIENSSNITVANYHSYRVVSSYQPFLNAIHVADSHNIRLRNIHVYGDNKVSFDNSVVIDGKATQVVRNREFASMTIDTSSDDPETQPQKASPVLADGSEARAACRRLLQRLRRCRRSCGAAVLCRRALAADLSLASGAAESGHRSRQPARSGSAGLRQGGRPDGGLVRGERDRVQLQA